VIQQLSNLYYRFPQSIQNLFARQWYEQISLLDRDADMIFMNYGFATTPGIDLLPDDESNRYCIQLYHRVGGAVELAGKDVLEVGCGRGGGASYLAKYLHPCSLVGVDLAANAIRFCQKHYRIPNLRFEQGNAENLKFSPGSFDAVLNVESSHCYNSINRFFDGVHRILKPQGSFLYADHRDREDLPMLKNQLDAAGFEILEEENLNSGVLDALQLDNARKQALIQKKVPRVLRPFFYEFAAMQGTRSLHGTLSKGEKVYMRFVLKKK
jgi:ubiquinone/menaquinone biosynthesis C-methylase UbiE